LLFFFQNIDIVILFSYQAQRCWYNDWYLISDHFMKVFIFLLAGSWLKLKHAICVHILRISHFVELNLVHMITKPSTTFSNYFVSLVPFPIQTKYVIICPAAIAIRNHRFYIYWSVKCDIA
jgi:hypothetical protein